MNESFFLQYLPFKERFKPDVHQDPAAEGRKDPSDYKGMIMIILAVAFSSSYFPVSCFVSTEKEDADDERRGGDLS